MNIKDKRFRYGTFSTAMMLFAVILFVFVNLVADEFNRSFDLTPDGIFSLSDRSHDFLDTLAQDVTITHVVQLGGQPHNWTPLVAQLLEEYDAASRHITVQERDPMISPMLIHQLADAAGLEGGIPEGSVVVQSGNSTRVVTLSEMLVLDWDMFGRPTSIRSYNFEAEITRAIHAVTQASAPVIYYVTGSGEFDLQPMLRMFLESENFEVREVNLVTQDVPAEADILLIPMPGRDWTEVKGQRVLDFLMDEGRAFIVADLTLEDMPVFNGVLASYGIAPINYLVIEGNPNNIWPPHPNAIAPIRAPHQINENVLGRDLPNFMFDAIGLDVLDIRRNSTNIEPLWATSRDAFARVDPTVLTSAKVPGDLDGPFLLAAAITDTRFVDDTLTTQLVVVSNMLVLSDVAFSNVGVGNYQFVLDAMRWLYGQSPSIFIPGRTPPGQGAQLTLNQLNVNVMTGIATAVLPLLCIAVGIFVWFRRRHN